MNFEQACRAMQQGHKVYRLTSSCDWFMRASQNQSRAVVCNFDNSTNDMDQSLYFEDLNAQDWEVIDETAFEQGRLKALPSWEDVSAAIEKADSEHCAALDKNVAHEEESL